jgi:hypothetical protein
VNYRIPAFAVIPVVAAAMFLTPSTGLAQGRRSVRVVRPAIVVAPYYYSPRFYDPFYFGSYYRFYQPPYGYGAPYERESALRLQVTPKETEVFVDGYFAGKADDFDGVLQRLRLAPGEHDVQLYLPGHRMIQQKIYLQPGATFRVRYAMEPLAAGDAEPVRPQGAIRPAGAAPRNNPAPAGSRDDLSTSGYGALALRVQPGDAAVTIDGERWEGSRDSDRLVVQLAPGVHRIEIRKEGYRAYSSEVTVRGGQTEALNVALTR